MSNRCDDASVAPNANIVVSSERPSATSGREKRTKIRPVVTARLKSPTEHPLLGERRTLLVQASPNNKISGLMEFRSAQFELSTYQGALG
jgi:hypothetical protein